MTLARFPGLHALWLTLLLTAPVAHAGLFTRCEDPDVTRARVHVYILPARAESRLTDNGARLATIMQRHILYAALKYESIAVAELSGDPEDCSLERLLSRLRPRLRPEQSAVFVSTALFEEDGAIYLQSDVLTWIAGDARTTRWPLLRQAGTTIATQASLPAEALVFPARRIPLEFLDRLADAQRSARRLRERPAEDAPAQDLPDDRDARYSFEVLEARPGWMRVRLTGGAATGWLPVQALASADALKGEFPELHFVDGLIGYLQLVAPSPLNIALPASRVRLAETATRSFIRYREHTSDATEAAARAEARVLEGLLALRQAPAGWGLDRLRAAQARFAEARAQAPGSAVAQNHYLACSAALCAAAACVVDAARLHTELLEAIAADPTNDELLQNLDSLYTAAAAGRLQIGLARDRIGAQQRVLEEARSAAR